ncbi:gluconate 2-dehydrogenase subunit 3 family protein [Haloarculaceae archaeon H-GB1-1]|nr:gluconate 2-dehydrogenase subunit 3 family protein [Haloarculaceae archaeon H-GB1-1]
MELSRRDALAVLAGGGILGAAGATALSRESLPDGTDGGHDDEARAASPAELVDALVATAHVVYPSEVSNVDEFVETYATGRIENRPEYREGALAALTDLNAHATLSYDGRYVDLDRDLRATLLDEVGVKTAEPNPDGTTAERVRYYLVNEPLYALYASPTGGTLVGIENPQGHPGGTESYQRGPQS